MPDLSVAIVAGLHADARRATVARLLTDVPGSVVLHHDLATAAAGTVVRTIRDATGIVSAGETPLVNDCACCALREDLVPELRRIAGAGQVRLAIVELWDSVEPKAMAEVITSGGLTVTGVITAVDPALLLPYLANGDDLAETGLAAAATDQRTVADTFARQLEYAPTLAVLDSAETDDEDRELLAQLHPTARQIRLSQDDLATATGGGREAPPNSDRLPQGDDSADSARPGYSDWADFLDLPHGNAPGSAGPAHSEPTGAARPAPAEWAGSHQLPHADPADAARPLRSDSAASHELPQGDPPGSARPATGEPAGSRELRQGDPAGSARPATGESAGPRQLPDGEPAGSRELPQGDPAASAPPAPGESTDDHLQFPHGNAPGSVLPSPSPSPPPGDPAGFAAPPYSDPVGQPPPPYGDPLGQLPLPYSDPLGQLPPPLTPLASAALSGFDVEAAAAAQHPACALLPVEADAYGVGTFVWHRCRPFHPERLYAALEDLTCAAARSRGRFWLADRPDSLIHWDAAGGALCVESAGPWLASLPDAAWELVPPVRRAAAALDWHPEHGDCCQHLVFTSPGLDREGLERLLESCLLTDTEYAAGRAAWKRLPSAFDAFLEI